MSGLLLELRRQIAHNRRKAAYEERMRASAQEKPQEVFSQKTKETKPDTEIQPEVQERKVNVVSREDFLLSQIDEFRERAKQLQSLLDSRETEAQELQTLVDERQEKADALGQILEERQKKADGFTAEVEKQIDRLIGKVSAKMEEIEVSMKEVDGLGHLVVVFHHALDGVHDGVGIGCCGKADCFGILHQVVAFIAEGAL